MEIIVYIIGGLLAGIATGLVGLSAATIIAPLFATVLGMNPYVAIGIALFSDIFASAISAVTYYKNKNINMKKALPLAIPVVIFCIVASILSRDTDPYNLNSALNIFVCVLGIRFIVYPVQSGNSKAILKGPKLLMIQTIIWGVIIGLISGWFGGGGGLSMLAVLTMLLGYGLKEGVGTSVFIMIFTAFVGSITHIIIGSTFILPLIITSISAFIGANLASVFANKVTELTLNRVVGSFLIVYGVCLVIVFYVF